MTLEEQVIELYRSNQSIKSTAKALGISHQLARRYLVLAGEYTNDSIASILNFYEEGKSVDEICALLGLKRTMVLSVLPYSKGTYKNPPSKNALRIRKYRENRRRSLE